MQGKIQRAFPFLSFFLFTTVPELLQTISALLLDSNTESHPSKEILSSVSLPSVPPHEEGSKHIERNKWAAPNMSWVLGMLLCFAF